MEGLPERAKTSTRQSVFEDTSFTTQKLPLWEVLELVSPTQDPRPFIYTIVDTSNQPRQTMRKKRRRWRRRKNEILSDMSKEFPETQRITPDLPRITTDNLQRETSPSSSIFSSLLQDAVPSAKFEDIIPPTELQSIAYPVPSKEMNPSEVLSSDISPCSEVEAVLKASQNLTRKKARKRRRISSKLSLSQSSCQQQQQKQHSQEEDDMKFLKKVVHIPNSITNSNSSDTTTITSSSNTTTTTSSSSSSSHKTNLGRSGSLDPSRCINILKQGNSSESGSPFEPSGLRGLSHPAKLSKQSGSVHTLKYRQIQSPQQGIRESTGGNVIAVKNVAVCRQHMSNKTLSFQKKVYFQSPSETVVQSRSSHHELQDHERPQVLSAEKWKDDTLTSNTEDLELSVYYEAHSHFILDESCSGPSGVQNNPKHPAGQAVLPIKQNVDADASRNSYSMKENYRISNSSSSSGFSTTEPESLLKKCVMLNKQQAGTLMRQVHKASQEENNLGKQKQIGRYEAQLGSFQGKKQSRTSREKLATIEGSKKRKGQDHVEVEPLVQNTRRLGQTIDSEVSSSTSEPLSEGELSDQQLQRTKRVHVEATLGWGSSAVSSTSSNSSSSSSSSSVLITPVMKSCIQAVGNVLKDYFGGTVEDNLRLMQKNDFRLLKCLSKLQAAEFSQPHLLSPRAAPL